MSPLGLIRAIRPGTVNIRGLNNVFFPAPTTGLTSQASGDGFLGTSGVTYHRNECVNNTAVDSRNMIKWSSGEAFDGFYRTPIAFNFFLGNLAIEAQGSVAFAIGEIPNTAPPHTSWRTDVTIRRMMLLVERSGAGVITYFMVACDGAGTSTVTVPSISLFSWVSLLYTGAITRRFELYVNGTLHGTLLPSLPAISSVTQFMASLGTWKSVVGAARNGYRLHGLGIGVGTNDPVS